MKIEIKSLAGSILFEGDFASIADALVAAVKGNANLDGANLDACSEWERKEYTTQPEL